MMTLAAGTKLGRYEIRSKLGEGGMGEVYLAEDTRLRRNVALKTLPSELAASKDRMRRFEQEAQAAAALNHPNIAHIYEIGSSPAAGEDAQARSTNAETIHFIAMEFIDGVTLRDKIQRDRTPLAKLLKYLMQVAEGLSKAHAAGIVHRDLKPDNIMITRDDYAKILDFGLAKLVEPQRTFEAGKSGSSEVATAVLPQQSFPGMVMGTVGYMSPEQASGRVKEIDHRSDIFSFGCILFEAATGQKAFEGKDVLDSLHKIVHSPTPQIRDINPDAPPELQRIVRRCLQKEPEKRYQSIKDVAIELDELRQELKERGEIEHSAQPESVGGSVGVSPETRTSSAPPSTADTASAQAARPTSSAEYIVSELKRHKLATTFIVGLLVLAVAAVVVWIYKSSGGEQKKAGVSFQPGKIQRLTTSGKVSLAAISPDGRYVIHVVEEAGQQSLWMRQTATAGSVQIIAPARVHYGGLTFSPDGNYLYFVRQDEGASVNTLYQTPVLGGAARKVLEDVGSTVTFSPDGRQFAFVRRNRVQGESLLIVANADGGERKLATQKEPGAFDSTGPAWSPDGKVIACGIWQPITGKDSSGKEPFSVIEVSVENGAMRTIAPQRWGAIGQLAWLRDSSGLLFSGAEQSSGYFYQIWYVARATGQAQRVTNDLSNYFGASLTADSSAAVTVQADYVSNVWVAPEGDASRARQVTSAKYDGYTGVAWTSDGRIVQATRTFDIWIMDADGGGAKPLTDDHSNYFVSVSPDSRYILFRSWRSGTSAGPHLWRMDVDGGNAKPLTSGDAWNPQVSPDGKWVVYQSNRAGKSRLWRVPLEGGEEKQLTEELSYNPAVSPDARWIACIYQRDPKQSFKLAIIPAEGGQPIKEFDIPQDIAFRTNPWQLRFSQDGRALDYLYDTGGVTNIWRQPVEGGAAKQLTDFKSDRIFAFDWSRDGKQLVLARGTVTRDVVLINNAK